MNRTRLARVAILLILAPLTSALAECPATPAGFHTYVGVDVATPETSYGHELDRKLNLLRLQIVWLPDDPDRRYRDKNVIDIDWANRSHTNVDVYDGQLQAISERNIHPVDLASNTDFETGQVHLITCEHAFRGHPGAVLAFAYYGIDGNILPDQTRVSTLTAEPVFGTQTAVINNTVSAIISGIFNDGIDQRVLDDVTLSTGVRPDHFLAQSILFQNLEPTQELLKLNPVSFFSPVNAKVLLNRVYITGDNASVLTPISIEGVSSDGFELMGPGHRIVNLENHVGTVTIRSGVSDKVRYGQVFEGRADLDFQAIACVDGRSKITARFSHVSDQAGEIRLFAEDSPAPFSRGSDISNFVSCERDYQLEAQRRFRFGTQSGLLSETGPIWIPLASTDTLTRVYFNSRFHGSSVIAPSVETLLKLFNINNIATLYGTHDYFCGPPGNGRVDTIDEIARRRAGFLTPEEQAILGPHDDLEDNQLAWDDSNGDGSICDFDELNDESVFFGIERITLAVYPPAG